jgi:hypothetical protein
MRGPPVSRRCTYKDDDHKDELWTLLLQGHHAARSSTLSAEKTYGFVIPR